ncbi:hypothetical protein LTR56_014286 [Elasticomyces elasticus]|nr:hypothetical protein LTR56_014286 [Elasticomyces elasticus]KAK5750455.1 hypothetical protein LTS12_019485 [Elasticomyces elasticus]
MKQMQKLKANADLTSAAAGVAQSRAQPTRSFAGAGPSRSQRRNRSRRNGGSDVPAEQLGGQQMGNGFYGSAGPAPFGPPVQVWQPGRGDRWADHQHVSDGFRASVAAAAAVLGPDAPPFRPGYDEPDAVERAWKAQEQLYDELDDIYVEQAAKDMGLDDQDVSAAGLETSAAQSELVYEDAYGNDIIRIWAAEEQRRQTVITDHYKLMTFLPRLPRDEKGYFVAPVETSAGPAVHAPPVHEIVLPPESLDRPEVNDVFDEPASAAAPEVPAVLPFQRDSLWAVSALDSAAVRSTSTFKTRSNLLRTHITAPGYDFSRPRPAPRTLLPPKTPRPLHPQPHVDRLVLRDQIRRQRAVQSTSILPRPQPRDNRPHLRVQTRFQQHEPAHSATLDDPSSGEYTSDEDFVPRAARRSIKKQRLLSKSERLMESETPASPPAAAERASSGTSQEPSSEVRSGFQRRRPANPIRITSAKTGKEVDLARQRAESPTPTRARAGRPVYVSASELAVKNLTAACPTARHVHAARELLLEETRRNVNALGEEH